MFHQVHLLQGQCTWRQVFYFSCYPTQKLLRTNRLDFCVQEISSIMGRVAHIRVTHGMKSLPRWTQSTSLPESWYLPADPVGHKKPWKTLDCLVSMPRIPEHGEDCILNVTLPIYNIFTLIMEKLIF